MNWKTWIPLLLAVVLGLVATIITMDMLAKNRGGALASDKSTALVVAKENIPPGQVLRAEDLTTSLIAAELMPAQAFSDLNEAVGRVALTQLNPGQAILDSLLAAKGAGGGLQSLVPQGLRAVTIEVNEYSGVAGLLTPGCHVDVISTVQNGAAEQTVSRTIVQNVKVTAVGQKIGIGKTEEGQEKETIARSVTLIASPKDAEIIELAATMSRPRLVLRSPGDVSPVQTQGVTLAELIGGESDGSNTLNVASLFNNPIEPATVALTGNVPSTQPVEIPDINRSVKVIRAGVESRVMMKMPAGGQAGSGAATISTDEVIAQ